MPGVVEPTEKQTLSNVVILKLVYTTYREQQRAVFAFSRTNSIEAYQKYLERTGRRGRKVEYDAKKI